MALDERLTPAITLALRKAVANSLPIGELDEPWFTIAEHVLAADTGERLNTLKRELAAYGVDPLDVSHDIILPGWTLGVSPDAYSRPWPEIDSDAYQGLPGQVVRGIDPYTEADPTGTLINYLAGVGNLVGRGAHYFADNSIHYPSLYFILVGRTMTGGKGTARRAVWPIFAQCTPDWDLRVKYGGLASGEGLVHLVRNKREGPQLDKKTGESTIVVLDEGSDQKEVYIIEEEFSGTLSVVEKDGSTLSSTIRKSWDGEPLDNLSKASPGRATDYVITIQGHLVPSEARARLSQVQKANGFGNRFQWWMVRKSKVLPYLEDRADYAGMAIATRHILETMRGVGEIRMDQGARTLWSEIYHDLNKDLPGVVGLLSARGAPQICRLATIYAICECSRVITLPHLRAALACWNYSLDGLYYLFGDDTGEVVHDTILRALRGGSGLKRPEIAKLFKTTESVHKVTTALADLASYGLIRQEERVNGTGRPVVQWIAEPIRQR